jgi:small subunit ribosomal protein S17
VSEENQDAAVDAADVVEVAESDEPEASTAATEPVEPEASTEAAAGESTSSDTSEPASAEADEAAAAPVAASVRETSEPPPAAEPKKKKKRLSRPLRSPRSKPKREKPAERRPIVRLEKPEHERGRRQERQGTVVSNAMDKTIVVRVDVIRAHPKYKKVVRRSTKFHAHDERNEAKIGDVVRIVETRRLSATKRWRLAEIIEVAK